MVTRHSPRAATIAGKHQESPKRKVLVALVAATLFAALAGVVILRAGPPGPAAVSNPAARATDWRFVERNVPPERNGEALRFVEGNAPPERAYEALRFVERNILPGPSAVVSTPASAEVLPQRGPR